MSSTMLAGRLDLVNTKFEMTHIDVPEPGVGEVRVKVRAAGICLSDVHLIDGTLTKDDIAATGAWQPTVTLGHEVAGEVEKVGPGVPPMWKVGARVLLAAGKRCGSCPPCIFDSGPCLRPQTRGVNYDGGWAEYAITHYQALIPIPDDLPFEQAAVIPDAVSTSYAGLVRTGGLRPGRSIGLWGVGGLGVHAVQIARAVGGAPVIAFDPLPKARERALAAGADLALDPADSSFAKQFRAATGGLGLDVAVDVVGDTVARDQALAVLGPKGVFSVIGLTPLPLAIHNSVFFCYMQQQIRGHYGYENSDLLDVVGLVRWHRLDLSASVTGLLALKDAPEGVRQVSSKEGDPIRLILQP